MPSLRQLEYLVAVAEHGSFTRAAEQLHVTQPALSHQIRALENRFGGAVLERLPRGVRLTPMGRSVLPHARAALADAARARVAAQQVSRLNRGELQIATIYSVSLGVLPAALRAWRRARPGVHIRLFEHRHADELQEAMIAGQADVAVGPAPTGWDGPVTEIGTEEFVLVLPPDDPAAARPAGSPVDLRDLADRQWVHYAPGHGLADILDRTCAAAGFAPQVAVRTEQTATAPILAAAGLGPTLTPANVLPQLLDVAVHRPDTPVTRRLTAYTRRSADPLTTAFVATLTEHASPAHSTG